MLTEVRLLLEHELDFPREQATLVEAEDLSRQHRNARAAPDRPLCTPHITAMTEETGVKVTEAFPRSPIRRGRIAEQIDRGDGRRAVFPARNQAVFHADPHAGNLLYDEPNRELVVSIGRWPTV